MKIEVLVASVVELSAPVNTRRSPAPMLRSERRIGNAVIDEMAAVETLVDTTALNATFRLSLLRTCSDPPSPVRPKTFLMTAGKVAPTRPCQPAPWTISATTWTTDCGVAGWGVRIRPRSVTSHSTPAVQISTPNGTASSARATA